MAKQKLMQKGVDPVSGNEKPVGALPEEVRDDVEAMLSEGEFVLPADVVRYIGLNNIMKLRDAAKAGLARMEKQGQMGNGDEQEVEGHNIDIEEMMEGMAKEKEEDETEMAFADGGMVQPVQPVQAASAQYVRPTVGNTPVMKSSQYTPVLKPQTPTTPSQVVPAPTGAQPKVTPSPLTAIPDYSMPNIAGDEIKEVIYVGPNGDEITIRFKGTVPLDPIPVGYLRKDAITPKVEAPEVEAPKIEQPVVEGTKQQSSSNEGSQLPATEKPKTDTKFALAEILAKDNPEMAKALEAYKKEYGDLDFSRMSVGDKIKNVMGRMGILGIVKTVYDSLQIGWAKDDLFGMLPSDMINYDPSKKDANTVSADLLSDWSTSNRDPIALMESASKAKAAGASNNLALAMAIDDRFDSSILDNMSSTTLSTWENTIAAMYGNESGSYVNSVIAKEDRDLFTDPDTGVFDLEGYKMFMGEDKVNTALETAYDIIAKEAAEKARQEAERQAAIQTQKALAEAQSKRYDVPTSDSSGNFDYSYSSGSIDDASKDSDYSSVPSGSWDLSLD